MKTLGMSLVAAVLLAAATPALAAETETTLASPTRKGHSSGQKIQDAHMSGNGRFVTFTSRSPKYVKADTNGARDVFVWDRRSGKTERVNVSSNGEEMTDGGCHCNIAARGRGISDDGRYVVFLTQSPMLARGDDDESPDGFVHDRVTGTTTLVTPGNGEGFPMTISPDGRYVLYYFYPGDSVESEPYIFDIKAGKKSRVDAPADGDPAFSGTPIDISSGGQKITFISDHSDNEEGPQPQVFMLDRSTDSMEQVSVSSDEQSPNQPSDGGYMSADGRYVVFATSADNLEPIGQDTNLESDVFVRDLESGTTTRVTTDSSLERLDGGSGAGSISDDGCRVAFSSSATNMVEGDTNSATDAFVRDLCADSLTRVSVASDGSESIGPSYALDISSDGRWVAFQSKAHNLTPDDTNRKDDAFLRGPL